MVKSQIYPDKINYNESKQVDDEDIGYASTIYDIVEHNIPIEIALGKEKHTYANHNIVYFSVYLILDNILKSRIGIVEIENNRLIDSIDEDGDFIIENGNLLIFVNEDYLHKLNLVTREEFDIQQKVLLKTRLKIEELEKRL